MWGCLVYSIGPFVYLMPMPYCSNYCHSTVLLPSRATPSLFLLFRTSLSNSTKKQTNNQKKKITEKTQWGVWLAIQSVDQCGEDWCLYSVEVSIHGYGITHLHLLKFSWVALNNVLYFSSVCSSTIPLNLWGVWAEPAAAGPRSLQPWKASAIYPSELYNYYQFLCVTWWGKYWGELASVSSFLCLTTCTKRCVVSGQEHYHNAPNILSSRVAHCTSSLFISRSLSVQCVPIN